MNKLRRLGTRTASTHLFDKRLAVRGHRPVAKGGSEIRSELNTKVGWDLVRPFLGEAVIELEGCEEVEGPTGSIDIITVRWRGVIQSTSYLYHELPRSGEDPLNLRFAVRSWERAMTLPAPYWMRPETEDYLHDTSILWVPEAKGPRIIVSTRLKDLVVVGFDRGDQIPAYGTGGICWCTVEISREHHRPSGPVFKSGILTIHPTKENWKGLELAARAFDEGRHR